jgi:hypothetical protein
VVLSIREITPSHERHTQQGYLVSLGFGTKALDHLTNHRMAILMDLEAPTPQDTETHHPRLDHPLFATAAPDQYTPLLLATQGGGVETNQDDDKGNRSTPKSKATAEPADLSHTYQPQQQSSSSCDWNYVYDEAV